MDEIVASTIAECVDETNVDRQSLLLDSHFFLLNVIRNQTQHGRPSIEFCLRYIRCTRQHSDGECDTVRLIRRTSATSSELQQRYDLQTHCEANETSELKFWPLDHISDLLNTSNVILPITPACHAALATYARLFL